MSDFMKKTFSFSLATLLSRLTGLVRDITLAHIFGTSPFLDSYFISISFPFFLRRIFAEGAMTSAFIPLYHENMKDRERRNMFVSSVLTSLGSAALSLVILTEIFPKIVPWLFASRASEKIIEYSTHLVRITSPFLFIVFVWSVFYSIHNIHGSYFLPALTPLLSNLGIIFGAILGRNITCVAIGFLIGSITTLIPLVPLVKKLGIVYKPTLRYSKEFFKLFFPTAFAMSASQIATIVDINMASFLGEGNVSSLQFASRLYQFPYGVLTVALSTVALPVLTTSKDRRDELNRILKRTLFLTIPAAFGLMILSKELVSLFYEHGSFSSSDTLRTSLILSFYSVGLPFYSMIAVLTRSRHAEKEVILPLKNTILISLTNAFLDIILGLKMGVSGVALATSISGVIGCFFMMKKMSVKISRKDLSKYILNGVLMTLVLALFKNLHKGQLWTIFLVILGAASYALFSKILRVEELREILLIFKRR